MLSPIHEAIDYLDSTLPYPRTYPQCHAIWTVSLRDVNMWHLAPPNERCEHVMPLEQEYYIKIQTGQLQNISSIKGPEHLNV